VNHPPVVSIDTTAARLGVHRRTVMRWIKRDLLVIHRDPMTRRIGVEVASVDALAARRVRVPR
jgi:hypothetical protein